MARGSEAEDKRPEKNKREKAAEQSKRRRICRLAFAKRVSEQIGSRVNKVTHRRKLERMSARFVEKDLKEAAGKLEDITELIQSLMKMERCSPHEGEDEEKMRWEQLYEGLEFVDDVHGHQHLDKALVIKARRLEMDFFKKMGVYEKVPRHMAKGCKIISTRWVDTNKGDKVNVDIRSRLVGREINKDSRIDLFAATPPLEMLKVLISQCAQRQKGKENEVGHHRHQAGVLPCRGSEGCFYSDSERRFHARGRKLCWKAKT